MEAAASTAVACNITVVGYKAGSSTRVETQMFEFVSAELVDLISAPISGTFGVGSQGTGIAVFSVVRNLTAVALFDNVVGSTQSWDRKPVLN